MVFMEGKFNSHRDRFNGARMIIDWKFKLKLKFSWAFLLRDETSVPRELIQFRIWTVARSKKRTASSFFSSDGEWLESLGHRKLARNFARLSDGGVLSLWTAWYLDFFHARRHARAGRLSVLGCIEGLPARITLILQQFARP